MIILTEAQYIQFLIAANSILAGNKSREAWDLQKNHSVSTKNFLLIFLNSSLSKEKLKAYSF